MRRSDCEPNRMSDETVRLTDVAVVVFDLDDTLYPERQFAWSGFEAVSNWLRQRMDCPGDPACRMRELFDGGCRGRVFNELLAEWACPHAADWLPQMIECYRNHTPVIRLHPDAQSALEKWQGRFQLSLISDGPLATQQNKVRALGLQSVFRPLVLTGQWGESFRKPHPRAFEYVETETGCCGSQCVYIGDNRLKDFLAPNRLGWRSVCVCRENGIYANAEAPEGGKPEFQIDSLIYLLFVQ